MNVINNFQTKKRYTAPDKKSKSTNRVPMEKSLLPSLKIIALNKEKEKTKENTYIKKPFLEIINQNRKKNNSQLNYIYPPKNHKPFSGNPLKFHMKKELNNINSIKYYQERDIFTANPYIQGHNAKKKNLYKKGNNIVNMNEIYNNNKRLIYPSYNINRNNNKNTNNLKNALYIHKYNMNPINYLKPSLFNSDDKSNNINNLIINQRTQKPNNFNNSNKIVIIANNNNINNNLNNSMNNNNKSEDMKKTMTSNISNEENIPLEKHLNLCFISYAYNEEPNLSHRALMEDYHYIKALLIKKISCSYFGLFDGHSGQEVGKYLMNNLHKLIHKKLKEKCDKENIDNNIIKNLVINSFEEIDKEINSLNFKNETGSTGTVLLLYKDTTSPSGKSFLCANVGDSKAYLITKQEMLLITKDHKCSDENEVKRIRDSGGIVFRERVFGTLMLTRSFGDKEMKKYGVLSTPDVFIKNVEKDDIFIVIASDGVWDVVEEKEIFDMSKENISSNDYSKKIIQLAMKRDTHDNISCVVIKLNKNN